MLPKTRPNRPAQHQGGSLTRDVDTRAPAHTAILAGPAVAPGGHTWGQPRRKKGLGVHVVEKGSGQQPTCWPGRRGSSPGAAAALVPGHPGCPAWMIKLIGPGAWRGRGTSTSGLGPGGGSCGACGCPCRAPGSSGSRWARGAAGATGRSGRTRRRSARSGPSWWPRPPRR